MSFEQAVEEHVEYLKGYLDSPKGVDKGFLIKDNFGDVVHRVGAISHHPLWYREYYKKHKRKPRKKDLYDLAVNHLTYGFRDEYGFIPPYSMWGK